MNKADIKKHLDSLEQCARIGNNIAFMLSNPDPDNPLKASGRAMAAQLAALHHNLTGEDLGALTRDFLKAQHELRAAQLEARRRGTEKWRREVAPVVWKTWHARARGFAGASDMEFITKMRDDIPCGDCKKGFIAILKELPPKWDDEGWSYFDWTVEVHNRVNEKLGKAKVTIEEAERMYA